MVFGDVLPVKLHASVNNLRGQVFSRLTVIEYEGKGRWRCRCECGNAKVVYGDNLEDCLTQSCGCLTRKVNAERMVNVGKAGPKNYTGKQYDYSIAFTDKGKRDSCNGSAVVLHSETV
jgi:hypothetical protein